MVTMDPSPTVDEFGAEAYDFLAAHQAPFQKFTESLLCLVGISHYYDLDNDVYPTFLTKAQALIMDLFAFIRHADPTKVRISERQIMEGQVPLLEATRGRVIPLAGENEQGDQHDNVKDVEPHDLDEGGDIQAAVADKPKVQKKRRRANGASGSDHPPKKLREDHSNSSNVSARTGGKSLVAIQELFERSTLNVEVGVSTAATVPFVTSSVTLTPERKGGDNTDSISGPNLRTQRPGERFEISSDSSHHSSTNVADVEVTSIVRSPLPPPSVMTAAVAANAIVGASSAPALGAGTEPIYVPKWNVINNSTPDDLEVCRSMIDQLAPPEFFSQLCVINYDQLFVEFNVGACQTCLNAEVRLRSEHNLRERKKFERKCEAEAAEAIHLRIQVFVVEATKAARASELDSLTEHNLALEGEKSTLEGQVTALEFTVGSKDTELASVNAQVAKLNDDLSSLQLSLDELSTKPATLKSQKDSLTDQVKMLSDRVVELDSDRMGMAVHLDEEFYPRFLTTIAGQR
ncbi:hypothetical protein Tco_1474623 [Tanacetum coccineum]